MVTKNTTITEQPVTQEFVREIINELKDEVLTEVKSNIASIQMKVDAKSLMTLGMDRLGLKTNYWNRAAWYAAGAATATVVQTILQFWM